MSRHADEFLSHTRRARPGGDCVATRRRRPERIHARSYVRSDAGIAQSHGLSGFGRWWLTSQFAIYSWSEMLFLTGRCHGWKEDFCHGSRTRLGGWGENRNLCVGSWILPRIVPGVDLNGRSGPHLVGNPRVRTECPVHKLILLTQTHPEFAWLVYSLDRNGQRV